MLLFFSLNVVHKYACIHRTHSCTCCLKIELSANLFLLIRFQILGLTCKLGDSSDTLVVTSCHLCRFHVDESRVTEAQSIGCPPASACSSSFDLSGVSPVVLRIVMKSDLPEDTKKSLLQVIELQSIIETLMFCCTVIILCVHS